MHHKTSARVRTMPDGTRERYGPAAVFSLLRDGYLQVEIGAELGMCRQNVNLYVRKMKRCFRAVTDAYL